MKGRIVRTTMAIAAGRQDYRRDKSDIAGLDENEMVLFSRIDHGFFPFRVNECKCHLLW
jgi:hypothetical protein